MYSLLPLKKNVDDVSVLIRNNFQNILSCEKEMENNGNDILCLIRKGRKKKTRILKRRDRHNLAKQPQQNPYKVIQKPIEMVSYSSD